MGVSRFQSHRILKRGYRLRMAALLRVDAAQSEMRPHVAGLQGPDPLKVHLGFGQPVELRQQPAPVEAGVGVGGIATDGEIESYEGSRDVVDRQQSLPIPEMVFGLFGCQCDSLPKLRHRLGMSVPGSQRHRQRVAHTGLPRGHDQSPPEGRDCFIVLAETKVSAPCFEINRQTVRVCPCGRPTFLLPPAPVRPFRATGAGDESNQHQDAHCDCRGGEPSLAAPSLNVV